MTDDTRVTRDECIGVSSERRSAAADRASDPAPASRGRRGRLWLVLASHLHGLEVAGVIDERSASAIAGALERAASSSGDPDTSLRQVAGAIEERVDGGLPAELAGAVTLGIAREDWTATATRLGLRDTAIAALDAAAGMQGALLAMADMHQITLMQGFHAGRPVQPITFAHLLGGAIGPAGEGIARGLGAVEWLNRSPLGAGTMAGEVVGAERAESAGWLGFAGPVPNTFDAVANVEDVVATLGALASVAAPVARMLGELAILVRTDPSALVFGDEWMREDAHLPGFTAAEGLVGLAGDLGGVVSEVAGLVTRLRALPYGPLGAALDWIDRDVVSCLDRFGRRFAAVERLFRQSLTVNRAYLSNRAGRDWTTSNDLAAFLMTEERLPPSVSRNIASLTMRRMREERVEMSAITPQMVDTAAMLVIGRELKVEPETLGRWFAPRRFLERRLVEGSPAPARTREWLEAEAERNRVASEAIVALRGRVLDAVAETRRWVEERASEAED